MTDFGKYLKGLRLKTNLTQTQFAAKLSIDTAALSKIENGKKDFDPHKIDILANEFELDLNKIKAMYFGEKFALELFHYNCPRDTFQIAERIYQYYKDNTDNE